MRRMRLVAVGLAATCAFLTATSPAAQASVDSAATAKAAGYVAAQIVGGDHVSSPWGDVSATADALLALEAADDDAYADEIAAMLTYLKSHAAAYASGSPEGAAKLAIVAAATGSSATSFGGEDLIDRVTSHIGSDGSFGSWPGPYAEGLGVLALARNGKAVPASMVTWLTESDFRNSDGGYSYTETDASDGDNTSMALLALLAVPHPSCAVLSAIVDAENWSARNQETAGYWPGYSPVNTTGVLGSALQAAGLDEPKAVTWMAGQQRPDGGLPATLDGTSSDFMATAQGIFVLAGTSYLDVPAKSPATVVTALPARCATSPTATVTATTTATSTATATATTTRTAGSTRTIRSSTTVVLTTTATATATVTATPTDQISAPPAPTVTVTAIAPATEPQIRNGAALWFAVGALVLAAAAGAFVIFLRARRL